MPTKPLDLRNPILPASGGGFDLRNPQQKPATSTDHPMARESPTKAKYSPKAQKKIGKVAIGISEAREAGLKVPKRRKKKAA